MYKFTINFKLNSFMAYVYIVFLFSAILKSVFIYYNINILDLTLLTSVFLSLDIIFLRLFNSQQKIYYSKAGIISITLFLLFYILCILSLITTPSKSYSFEKVFLMLLNVLSILYPIFNREINIEKFKKSIKYIIIPISIWFIFIYNLRWGAFSYLINIENMEKIRANYLVLSSWLGIYILMLSYKNDFLINKRIILVVFLIMLLLGGRGPFLFALVILLFNKNVYKSIVSNKISLKQARISILLISSMVIFFLLYFEKIITYLGHGFKRFLYLFDEGGGNSVVARTDLLDFSFYHIFHDSFFQFLIGHGIGSFNFFLSGEDSRYYPHNILVEAWFELGVIGFIVLGLFILTPFLKKKSAIPLSIIIFLILNALKTSSFVDIRILYGFFSIYFFSNNLVSSKQNNE
ncbi:MAG: oligosaccharide repeat unit polymerase [Bacteroidales bacterium]|nr:oligosaccharide repeat unit polymerase [Bacteroidales bacterium]MBN2757433.1 oligosaccharide repeat unit polymerase [Bacteroidales bacterium]